VNSTHDVFIPVVKAQTIGRQSTNLGRHCATE
jgi:hypothetical protein